jgi:hypothetical protein
LENLTLDFGMRISNLESMISKREQNKRLNKLEIDFKKYHENCLKKHNIQFKNFR